MRVTSTSYYNNIYGENNKLNQQLFDVNKQIASGQKIQYAHEDPGVFIDTLRLDNEITTLTQTKNSTDSAYKLSTQTDTTIGDIVKTLETIKVKLINASTDSQSDASLQAIAKEIYGLKNHLLTLANTSIGGQFLFSGTATAQKPIDGDGAYQGNDKDLKAFLGSELEQKYNISGSQLFLGNESNISRTITTNVPQFNLTDLHATDSIETYITPSSTIGDLLGNTAINPTVPSTAISHFYIQGTRSNGEAFKAHIPANSSDKIDTLLKNISDAYEPSQVNVTLNAHGQIEISDKSRGSSKLDFHIVGAVDFDTINPIDDADVTDIDDLQAGTTNFNDVLGTTATPNQLFIKEFTKSGFDSSDPLNTIEGINYDRTNFEQDGTKLFSNVSQIVKKDNTFAQPSTKLLDVAGVVVPTLPLLPTLNGQQLIIQGKDITGAAFTAQIDLLTAGSKFSINGNGPFDIFTATAPRSAVDADKITYQQLIDVINIAASGTLPTANTDAAYDTAITTSNSLSSTTLDYAGRIVFEEINTTTTQASLSIHDSSSDTYPASGITTNNGTLTFNANNALTIRDPKKDFFAQIDETIASVEEGKTRSNGSDELDPRNIGIQNSIQVIDDLADHVSRLQAESGSYSNVLRSSSDRSSLLIVNSKILQSEIIDTDIAEATLRLQQLSLNYQALLSSISRVSQLSLVNYL